MCSNLKCLFSTFTIVYTMYLLEMCLSNVTPSQTVINSKDMLCPVLSFINMLLYHITLKPKLKITR